MTERYVVLVKVRAPFGISVYYPLVSTTAPTYPLPPPTTLVGALAYPYLRETLAEEYDETKNYSSAVKILNDVLYAAAGAEGWMMSRDAERIYQLIYQREGRWEGPKSLELAFTVGVRGNVYYVNDMLYILYVIRNEELAKYAYGITRIGRKESMVCVEDLVVEKLHNTIKPVRGAFKTYFYFPDEVAVCKNAEVLMLPKLVKENFGRTVKPVMEKYCVSRGLEGILGELKTAGVLIEVGGLQVPIPKYLVSS